MTGDRDLAMVDEVIAELEELLSRLRQRRTEQTEQEATRADQG